MTITLSPAQLALAALALGVLFAALAFGAYAQLEGGSSAEPVAIAAAPTQAPSPEPAPVSPTTPPEPTSPPQAAPPQVRTCAEIQATGYQSEEERAF
jgi:outer membrane biosynthesis protein TonB